MGSLKDQLNDISGDSRSLLKDYWSLFSIKQAEKLSLFLGILASFFILSTILLILIVFGSFFLAGALNSALGSGFWGYLIVGGAYLVVIGFLVIRMIRMKKPLFYGFFIKVMVNVLNIQMEERPDPEGIKLAEEKVRHRIDTHQMGIKSKIQILRFTFLESLFKEFISLFKFSKKNNS